METVQPRLAFCCKFMSEDGDADTVRRMNATTVTMAHLARLGPIAGRDKLLAVVGHNLEAVRRQILWVAARPSIERALRILSDILPAYNHPLWRAVYREPDMRDLVESGLAAAGKAAREGGVRLSTHPDQFCVLGTLKEGALANSVAELEYHADMMEMMGLAGGWHPEGAHVNVHGGAKAAGIEGFRAGFARLSRRAKNLVTVENDEVSYGLDDLLPLADTLPIVLDLHHHWIASRGEYLEPDDPRIARVAESWRGVRPMSHISVSREDLLVGHDTATLPNLALLVAAGIKPHHLRGHSNLMWNEGINDLVARHLAWSDFEVEAKHKNLATTALARFVERRSEAAEAAA
ncbi:MAG TPA: UV damage endonuclease UvsE [Enterovirga sp.]|nr:UV damage endonuclease UvsE [Enterovirga sp.]